MSRQIFLSGALMLLVIFGCTPENAQPKKAVIELTVQDTFTKKQECYGLLSVVKENLDEYIAPYKGVEVEVTEIFYSPSRETCVVEISRSGIDESGNDFMELYIEDAFTTEQLRYQIYYPFSEYNDALLKEQEEYQDFMASLKK